MSGRRRRMSDGDAPPPVPPDTSSALVSPVYSFPDPIHALVPFGSICTLSGASGVGKTAFIAGMIATIQRGEPFCGHQTHLPPAIGVFVCDRPWRDHNAWFQKAGCGDLPHLSLRDIDNYSWDTLRDYKRIPQIFGSLIDQINLPPGSLLIVDPLPLFIPGRLIDYKDVAIGLGHLDQQLKARGLTMLGVFHVSKQKSNKNDRYMRPQDRILGSSALIGYSETAFYLLSPDEAETHGYEFGAISHQLPPIVAQYKRTENGLFTPAHDLDGVGEEEKALAAFPAAGTTVSASVLYETLQRQLKCSESTAKRLVGRLLGDGRVRKLGRGIFERATPS